MARAGWAVTVIDKQPGPGGRAQQWQSEGFTFDMGPSWYWMPDIFEHFFRSFEKKVSDYYELIRLDPSYRVYWPEDYSDIPAGITALRQLFESIEPGAGAALNRFMAEAGEKYREGMKMAFKPGVSITEFMSWPVLKAALKLDLFSSVKKHVHRHFKHPKLRMLMEFPSLFLGALPAQTPALYTLMNYADSEGGTWYPRGGMYKIAEGMQRLATELGVQFRFGEEWRGVKISGKKIVSLQTDKAEYETDVMISGADYHYSESLLPPPARSYSDSYWASRKMAPSCLLYYVGLNKKIPGLRHHSLFFDTSFPEHAAEIYDHPRWPAAPLFYVSAVSVTDPGAAPAGGENLFLLIPVATGLSGDSEDRREAYFRQVLQRLEQRTGVSITDAIVLKRSFGITDFESVYHSFRGNAYGLANTLRQTAVLKPGCRSKKLENLFYCGQLTVPGPGVPPSLISGEIAASEVLKSFG